MRLEELGGVALAVMLSSAGVLAVGIAVTMAVLATMRRARERARSSSTGTAGAPPLMVLRDDVQPGMWTPATASLQGWSWSGGRLQPPDVLGGLHAVYDTVIAREIRGTFHGRAAFAQVRALQRLPVLDRTAPQTRWSRVAALQSRVVLPPFFILTEQPSIVAGTYVLDAAAGMDKLVAAVGPRTILWADRACAQLLAHALSPMLAQGTPESYLFASDGATMFVCESLRDDEEAVRQRLLFAERAVLALEATLMPPS